MKKLKFRVVGVIEITERRMFWSSEGHRINQIGPFFQNTLRYEPDGVGVYQILHVHEIIMETEEPMQINDIITVEI